MTKPISRQEHASPELGVGDPLVILHNAIYHLTVTNRSRGDELRILTLARQAVGSKADLTRNTKAEK